jgi:thymidylate synthase ThyX
MPTQISARIVADSVNAQTRDRVTTMLLTYPRLIHSELLTHRAFSRNAASSRAIPVAKQVTRVLSDPAGPVEWGRNQPGMHAVDVLTPAATELAKQLWENAAQSAAAFAERLSGFNVHKQIANRVLEPFTWMTTLVTATEWGNFFALRAHRDAQPEFQHLADEMLFAYVDSAPVELEPGKWHLPFGDTLPEELDLETRLKVVTARAARTSYVAFDKATTIEEDVALHDRLRDAGHWSPFEHPAQAMRHRRFYANFRGWGQYRGQFFEENREMTLADLKALARQRRAAREA